MDSFQLLLVIVVFGIIAFLYQHLKSPALPSLNDESYQLSLPEAPKLSGRTLGFFIRLMFFVPTKIVLVPILYSANQFYRMHEFVTNLEPLFYPLVAPLTRKSSFQVPSLSPEEFLKSVSALPLPEGEFRTINHYAEAYRSGRATPEDVIRKCYEAIYAADANSQRPLKAFVHIAAESAMASAKESAQRFASGTARSVLEGVPIGIKDEFHVAGMPTRVGTAFLPNVNETRSATAVKRLQDMGAIVLGKCTMHEIGISTLGFNPHANGPRNPYNLNHFTGGSSSGSAAAVATGICPVALAADGGGSIRIPAALCGMVGLKPTHGRVSEDGAYPLCPSVAHAGPIAATVRDVAISYAVMAGLDENDPHTSIQSPVVLPDFRLLTSEKPLKGLRLGVYWPWFRDASQPVVQECMSTLTHLESAGARVVEINIRMLEAIRLAHFLIITSEMALAMRKYTSAPSTRGQFGLDALATLSLMSDGKAIDYLKANSIRAEAIQMFRELFHQVDVIVTPTTPITAPAFPTHGQQELNGKLIGELMRFAAVGNFCGLPAISVPAGYSGGLPVGIQFCGQWWSEDLLLTVAHVAEKKFTLQPPPTHVKII